MRGGPPLLSLSTIIYSTLPPSTVHTQPASLLYVLNCFREDKRKGGLRISPLTCKRSAAEGKKVLAFPDFLCTPAAVGKSFFISREVLQQTRPLFLFHSLLPLPLPPSTTSSVVHSSPSSTFPPGSPLHVKKGGRQKNDQSDAPAFFQLFFSGQKCIE